ncbi:hypothetical protein LQF12_00270 [Ruania suaedae]|uniref:xylulokinase n=1 Tax=Ruania suaedae TaxID=2897774 RepID=UPI001E54BB9A|nr:FGGY family carbohydrate kinase [Ruania suaedae]UFU03083.1 hypothetical protein LQF12_00270 [Ruania suaedae]
MDVVIGVDASTTGTKAVAFGPDGTVHAITRTSIARRSPEPTWHEQDAQEWWDSTLEVLTGAAAELEAAGHTVRGLGLTAQRESFVCLDDAVRPIRPAMLWLDARAGAQVERFGDEDVHRISGKPPSTTPSFYKLAWLAEHEPATMQAARYVADVHGFLSHRLTGSLVTSSACADPMGLVDMATGDWADELLARVGLDRDRLPALTEPGTQIGGLLPEVAARTGLPAGLPVVAGAGDGQCGGLGSGVSRQGRAYLSLGTSVTLGAHAPDGAPHSWDYRLLGSPLGTGMTVEGYINSGALSVAWFRKAFAGAIPEDPAELEQLLDSTAPGAGGLRYLPYLSGSTTPYWDERARGTFIGFTESHGAGEFYRAVLEGLALEAKVLLDRLEVPAGRIEEITVIGGGSASDTWLSIIAGVLGRQLAIGVTTEATALGAAILAASAVGLVPGGVAAAAEAMVGVERRIQPDPALMEVYGPASASYAQLYPALKDWFRS